MISAASVGTGIVGLKGPEAKLASGTVLGNPLAFGDDVLSWAMELQEDVLNSAPVH